MQPCYDVLIIFSSWHIAWCIKSRTRLFKHLSSIFRDFCHQLRQCVPYEAENWHAWSHEQYFSKHRFSDICRCAFSIEISEVDHRTWIFTSRIFRLALEITFLLNKYFFFYKWLTTYSQNVENLITGGVLTRVAVLEIFFKNK